MSASDLGRQLLWVDSVGCAALSLVYRATHFSVTSIAVGESKSTLFLSSTNLTPALAQMGRMTWIAE